MPRFEIDRPITTAEPTVTVDAGLPAGRHRFRLVVVGARRQPSAPDDTIVEIRRLTIDPGPAGPVLVPRPGVITGPAVSPSPRRTRARSSKKEKP